MTVICADPDQRELRRLRRILRRVVPRAAVHCCRDPDEAAELARSKGCDVLFTEVNFSGRGDGITLAETVKAAHPRVNLIFMTPKDYRAGDYEGFKTWELFPSGWFKKPCTEERLTREFINLRYPAERKEKEETT